MSARVIDVFSSATDLPRHLKDGELLMSSSAWKLLHTNFYSYTYPDAPFVYHHSLATLVFYAAWKCAGFAGLNLFYIAIGALAFVLYFHIAEQAAGFFLASVLALYLLPLLSARISVRPDVFTFLMCGVFFTLLWREYNSNRPGSRRGLLIFPVLQIVWVNLHAGFLFGPVFVCTFLVGELIAGRRRDHIKHWALILLLTLAACLINPSGVRGALYPFTLAGTLDFPTAENQPVFDLRSQGVPIEFGPIMAALGFLAVSFAAAAWNRRFVWPLFGLAAMAGTLTLYMYRNYPLLGFLALAITAINAGSSGAAKLARRGAAACLIVGVALAGGVYLNVARLVKDRASIGLGMKPGRDAAAKFFLANGLKGPILNNFDDGGYLIYYLFPRERVYIDTRPEAYPEDFLDSGYLRPIHEEPEWERILAKYQFNAIVFSWAAEWEGQFIARRMLDSRWATVFVDHSAVVMLRRTEQNQELIRRFEVPRERLPIRFR